MMILALLASLAIGSIFVVAFWDEIVDCLKKLVASLRRMFSELKKKIAHFAGAFIERIERGLAAIRHKLYYKEEGEWIEETTTRKIKESEIPANIRRKLRDYETEVTEEVEKELELTLN